MAAKAWYCTWCGEAHVPDQSSQLDARYATGRCAGNRSTLIQDRTKARDLADTIGKNKPREVRVKPA